MIESLPSRGSDPPSSIQPDMLPLRGNPPTTPLRGSDTAHIGTLHADSLSNPDTHPVVVAVKPQFQMVDGSD
jgi:hypothetical protein